MYLKILDGGEPVKFNQARVDVILELLRQGISRRGAAETSGVSARTLQRWMKKGEDGEGEEWELFTRQVHGAEASAEYNAVNVILEAAEKGDWRAAAWWLERRHPQQWGKRQRIEVETEEQPVEFIVQIGGQTP